MAVDTGQGRVRPRPDDARLPAAYEGSCNVLGPVNVQVARPAYDRLTVLQGRLRGEKGRPVSYSEAVEWLLDHQREEVAR